MTQVAVSRMSDNGWLCAWRVVMGRREEQWSWVDVHLVAEVDSDRPQTKVTFLINVCLSLLVTTVTVAQATFKPIMNISNNIIQF